MRVIIYSEDNLDGLVVDWPVIPRQGEIVRTALPAGVTHQSVRSVEYNMTEAGELDSVLVHLVY